MSEARVSNPLVEQFRVGSVPRELRLMAAQGALPLKSEDLLDLYLLLIGDRDDAVRQAATDSLGKYPAADLRPLLKDRSTPPAVLGWAVKFRTEADLREFALQNVATPDEAIEEVAAELPESLAELVVINQVRLLRRTSLLETLERNPNLNRDQNRRLRELRESFRIGAVEAPPAVPAPPPAPEPEPEPEPAAAALAEIEISEEEAMNLLDPTERTQEGPISVVKRIFKMSTSQKVITALKSGREERSILIRDPNRLVCGAVLGSPKLTDAEVEGFAAMKNVSDEVLRRIGKHREWTKKYNVVANLVKNPRTPIGISLGLVSRLNPRDIKLLAVDKNVSEAVRKAAQRFVKSTQPQR
ncbi:MAG: hypothetical protein NDJ94_06910 [Vicinamibacteria bacterium]|jgi:hypothetical protein|nr:hypothetical protein [Vicinamibacteria bacterium]